MRQKGAMGKNRKTRSRIDQRPMKVKDIPGRTGGRGSPICRRIMSDPSVAQKIDLYAREVAPELGILPASNVFPVLSEVIGRAMEMGCTLRWDGEFEKRKK